MIIKLLIIAATAIVMIPRPAHAYLDPGTGSYVIQFVIAGALGAAFAIKVFWMRIRGFFSRMVSRGNDDS